MNMHRVRWMQEQVLGVGIDAAAPTDNRVTDRAEFKNAGQFVANIESLTKCAQKRAQKCAQVDLLR